MNNTAKIAAETERRENIQDRRPPFSTIAPNAAKDKPAKKTEKLWAAAAFAAAIGLAIFAKFPATDPKLTNAITECVNSIKESGPVMIAYVGGNPESYCRNFVRTIVKPLWDEEKILEEQRKFDAQHGR
jgi:hypothetical protein